VDEGDTLRIAPTDSAATLLQRAEAPLQRARIEMVLA